MDITLKRILSLLPHKDNGDLEHGAKLLLAKQLGFSSGNLITAWEKGRSDTYYKYLYEIAHIYNVSVEWLKGETYERSPINQRIDEASRKLDLLTPENRMLAEKYLDFLLANQEKP